MITRVLDHPTAQLALVVGGLTCLLWLPAWIWARRLERKWTLRRAVRPWRN